VYFHTTGHEYAAHKNHLFHARSVRGGQDRLPDHLIISSPFQASTWNAGSLMSVTWDTREITGNVRISLSREGGRDGTYQTLAETTENDGSYEWTVTEPGSVNCALKIEPLNDPSKGTTQGLFTILPVPATVSGTPPSPTNQTDATLLVSGYAVVSHKYKMDNGAYSHETDVSVPLELTDLSDGDHTIHVIGKSASGIWQSQENPTTVSWRVETVRPSVSITSPQDGSETNMLYDVEGRASDTSGQTPEVELQISDGKWYLTVGESGHKYFTRIETWIPMSQGDSWSFDTDDVYWRDTPYTIAAKATDKAGNSETDTVRITITDPCQPSAITCEISESRITLGETFLVQGRITPVPTRIGAGVNVAFISPDGQDSNKVVFADKDGEFSYDTTCDEITRDGRWTVQTSWAGGVTLCGADSEALPLEVSKAETRVILDVSSQSVKSGDQVIVFGRFLPIPVCEKDFSDLGLSLTISGPDGTIIQDTREMHTENELGQFQQEYDGFREHLGEWGVQAVFEGDDAYLSSESEPVPVRVVETAGYAIIIQGRTRSGEGLADHNRTTRSVYETLRQRDLQADDIRHFNYDTGQAGVYGIPSETAVSEAVTLWAKEKMNEHPANLYIVMVNHGSEDRFYIHGSDPISPSDMDGWLDTLRDGLSDQARKQEIVLVLGFCHSGSFIPELSGEGRVIITSAAGDEVSFRGNEDETGVREGEYFVAEFFRSVSFGKSVRECFEEAAILTEGYTSDQSIPLTPPYYDHARQHPLLDDNGDGKGTNDLSVSGGDGPVSEEILSVGVSTRTENAPGDVSVSAVARTLFLSDSETHAKGLWAQADNLSRLGGIWAEVKPPVPDTETVGADTGFDPALTGQLAMNLTKIPTSDYDSEKRRHEWNGDGNGIGGFDEPGIYQVFYFARDAMTRNVCRLMETRVYKNKVGNREPNPFSLIFPGDGEEDFTFALLDWEDTSDPDGDSLTYTLLADRDVSSLDTEPAIQKEGLSHSMAPLGPGDGIEAGRDYYWKVLAVDEYGAVRESETWMFHTPLANPDPSWIQGHVYNADTKDPVATFDVVVGDETLDTASEGYYIGEKSPGKYDVMIEAVGYVSDRAEVVITEGEVVTKDFGLRENRAADPVFSPPPGIYTAEQNIRISCATSGAVIRHTADGNDPDENSDEYISPVPVSGDVTIRARAYKTGMDPSRTVTAGYRISTDGNINDDDRTDLADVILILRLLTGTETASTVNMEAETGGDEKIGLADAIHIMKTLAELQDLQR